MRKLGSENGAITMVTLITIIFMVSFLISSYVMVANKVKTQKEMLAQTKAIYEPKLSMEEVYNSYFTNGDIIPIYTVEELLKIGSDENDTKNGKTYAYSYSANYLLMSDLEFTQDNWLAPYENDDFKNAKGNFDWNGHTIKVTTSSGITTTYDGKYLVTINTTENPKVLKNAVKSNLVNYKIEGNSVQNGTPSPTNPVEIQSVGIANLYDAEELIYNFQNNKIETTNSYQTTYLQLKPNTTYYMKVFNPVDSNGYFFVNTSSSVNSVTTTAVTIVDETGRQYPRKYENSVTTDETGKLYFGYYNVKYEEALRNCKMLIIEGIYSKYSVPEYIPSDKYLVPVTISGKNLLNPNTVEDKNSFVKYNTGANANPSSSGGTWRVSDFIYVSGGKTYHFNAINSNASGAGIAWYDMYKNYISGATTTTINNNNGNIVAPENARYLRVSWRIDEGYNPNWQNTVQLEEGTVATPYDPYNGQTYNIYLNEPLRKAGNSADYIDFETGKVIRKIKEITVDGENWLGYYTGIYEGFRKKVLEGAESRAKGLSNKSLYVGEYYNKKNSNAIWVGVNDDLWIYWIYSDYYDETLEGRGIGNLQEDLNEEPLVIQYESKNDVPDEEIDLPNIQLYKGTNIITVGTEIAPSNMTITYNAKQ